MGGLRRTFVALVVLGLSSTVSLPGDILGYDRALASESGQALEGTQRWQDLIEQASAGTSVPNEVIQAMMAANSSLETDRRTAVDGVGLLELRPAWQPAARDFDGELADPATNVRAAATVLSEGYAAWGSWDMAVAAYAGMLDTEGNLVDAEDGTSAEEYIARFQRNLADLGYQPGGNTQQTGAGNESPAEAQVPGRMEALKHALTTEGTPYVYGGESLSDGGFDCSGLMKWAYGKIGTALPRSAGAQWQAATPIDRGQLAPGDLIFFANTYMPGISHVAMYAGDGLMIHATHAGEPVTVEPLSSQYWSSHIAGFGRVQ